MEQITNVTADSDLVKSQSSIFKLHVVCFEELFEWLSVADLRALRQTCKRFKRLIDYYIELNYPLAFRRLSILNHHLEFLRRADPNGFELLQHVEFLTTTLSRQQIDDIKYILCRLKSVCVESTQINDDFYDAFLRQCQRLKCLRISKIKSGSIIGSGNEWLLRSYPTIEHIVIHTPSLRHLDLATDTFQMKTFFELNPKIQTFSTTFEFISVNGYWMLQSDIKFNELNVSGACNTELSIESFCNLLKKLYANEFYMRLCVTVAWIERQDDVDQITSLPALEQLCLKSISIKIDLPQMITLKELCIYAYEHFDQLDVCNLVNVEQIYFAYASIDDILPFISDCKNLKQITVNHLDSGRCMKNGIINMFALNAKRKQLAGARKLIFYINEKLFLTRKWTSKTNFDLIELKRIQCCKREQLYW